MTELRRLATFSRPVEAHVRIDGGPIEQLVVDTLSPGGAFMRRRPPLPLGTGLCIWLPNHPDDIDELRAVVVSISVGQPAGNGVSFGPLSAQQRRLLTARSGRGEALRRSVALSSLLAAPLESAAAFAARHPYPFLVPEASDRERLRADAEVYRVRSSVVQGGWSCPIHVGRDERADVSIGDPSISRHHAVFEQLPERPTLVLLDKGSRNGTRVNGQRLAPMTPVTIMSGATVAFGDLCFRFLTAGDLFTAMHGEGI